MTKKVPPPPTKNYSASPSSPVKKSVAKKTAAKAKNPASTSPGTNPKSKAKVFDNDFQWGCATAAYQIEGAYEADGKGPSIWDTFTSVPGNVVNNDNARVGCSHYYKMKEDVALMAELGFKNYRFSISWPRIFPDGTTGNVNQKGLDFYNDLIDELLAHGIEPLATLYHWDLPEALQAKYGGFLSNNFVQDFVDYSSKCFEFFGDRVKKWITFNEPSCICVLGFGLGMHAPGRCSDPGTEVYLSSHYLLLAHAYAVEDYRKNFQDSQAGVIGITLNSEWWEPASSDPLDLQASQRALDFTLGLYAEPIWGGGDYPASVRAAAGDRLPKFTEKEKSLLMGSSDFFGLNHYATRRVGHPNIKAALSTLPREIVSLYKTAGSLGAFLNAVKPLVNPFQASYFKDMDICIYPDDKGTEYTEMRWAVVPWGFRKLLNYVDKRYRPEGGVIVTENGLASDEKTVEDALKDTSSARVPFFEGYLGALHDAITIDKCDIRGYYAWSFLDNFEWSFGNDKRFGLVHVDYDTLKRTPKPVAYWFKKLMDGGEIPKAK